MVPRSGGGCKYLTDYSSVKFAETFAGVGESENRAVWGGYALIVLSASFAL